MTAATTVKPLLINATATKQGVTQPLDRSDGGAKTVQARVTGSGAVSASVDVYGSNINTTTKALAQLLFTLSPTGTTNAQDAQSLTARWPFVFADLTAISGTSATVNVDVAG